MGEKSSELISFWEDEQGKQGKNQYCSVKKNCRLGASAAKPNKSLPMVGFRYQGPNLHKLRFRAYPSSIGERISFLTEKGTGNSLTGNGGTFVSCCPEKAMSPRSHNYQVDCFRWGLNPHALPTCSLLPVPRSLLILTFDF
jgi:hypothetical protein